MDWEMPGLGEVGVYEMLATAVLLAATAEALVVAVLWALALWANNAPGKQREKRISGAGDLYMCNHHWCEGPVEKYLRRGTGSKRSFELTKGSMQIHDFG